MNNYYKFGRAMVWAGLVSFVVYTFCFGVILIVNPPFVWTNMADFAAYVSVNPQIWKYLGMASMIIFACAYLMLVVCAGECAGPGKSLSARLAALFALAFAICISINYFVQLTATRLQMSAGQTEGLLQFTQSFNISALGAINMLGWTLFYGLSSLFLVFCLWDNKPVRIAGLANTIMMAFAMIGYGLNNYLILLVTMNIGLGGAGLALLITMLCYFRQKRV